MTKREKLDKWMDDSEKQLAEEYALLEALLNPEEKKDEDV